MSVEQPKVNGGILFIDVSSLSAKCVGGKCDWLFIPDDCSDNI